MILVFLAHTHRAGLGKEEIGRMGTEQLFRSLVFSIFTKCHSSVFLTNFLSTLICSNTIQFTHTQIEAIRAGMQPGLTMVRELLLCMFLCGFRLEVSLRCFECI